MIFTFELFPEYTIYLQAYASITNASQLRANVRNFSCAFINPKLVSSVKHILAAANRAIYGFKNDCKKTDSIYSDLVYYLSPSSNIRGALQHFGIQEDSESIIVACFEASTLLTLDAAINGTRVEYSELSNLSNLKGIQNLFKISDKELQIDQSLSNAISTRIALKDFK